MDKKVKQVKLLREEECKYINGELSFRHIDEHYNTNGCDLDHFLENIDSRMEIIKNHAKKVLACFDTLSATEKEIHTLDEDDWYITTRFSIIYEGEE